MTPKAGRRSTSSSHLVIAVALTFAACGQESPASPSPLVPSAVAAPAPSGSGPWETRFSGLPSAPRIPTGRVDALGREVSLRCGECHTRLVPNPTVRSGEALERFHQGLTVAHGELTCLSCHDERDYDRLRLADGVSLAYPEVMTLCRQCHGPQMRDYRHGAHGGMQGYWDRTRGPRTRNACVVCHDPHAPAFVGMLPARGPVDRFHQPGDGTHD